MAAKTETEHREAYAGAPFIGEDRRVRMRIPRIPGQKEQPDVFISINGKNYLIQRGVEVEVPIAVFREYMRAERNNEKAEAFYYAAADKAGN